MIAYFETLHNVARSLLLQDLKDWREAQSMMDLPFVHENDSRFNIVLAGQNAVAHSIKIQLHILDGMAGAW